MVGKQRVDRGSPLFNLCELAHASKMRCSLGVEVLLGTTAEHERQRDLHEQIGLEIRLGRDGFGEPRLDLVTPFLGDEVPPALGAGARFHVSGDRLSVASKSCEGGVHLPEGKGPSPAEVRVVVTLELIAVAWFTVEKPEKGHRNTHRSEHTLRVYSGSTAELASGLAHSPRERGGERQTGRSVCEVHQVSGLRLGPRLGERSQAARPAVGHWPAPHNDHTDRLRHIGARRGPRRFNTASGRSLAAVDIELDIDVGEIVDGHHVVLKGIELERFVPVHRWQRQAEIERDATMTAMREAGQSYQRSVRRLTAEDLEVVGSKRLQPELHYSFVPGLRPGEEEAHGSFFWYWMLHVSDDLGTAYGDANGGAIGRPEGGASTEGVRDIGGFVPKEASRLLLEFEPASSWDPPEPWTQRVVVDLRTRRAIPETA